MGESPPASPVGSVSSGSSGYPSLGSWGIGGGSDEDEAGGSPAAACFGFDGSRDDSAEGGGGPGRYLPAIFVHAGAGFHSHHNERIHLAACEEAASAGIKALRAGASAVEAVEAALRSLEDKEVTNAGFGSNLSIDGTVECDATIVDHLGRSGACGAVPNIRHPVSLAKLILDRSNVPLTLRRVPPNILVGQGARSFAKEHGMLICPNDALVSKNAHDRFRRWQEELHRADARFQTADKRGDDSPPPQITIPAVPPIEPAPPIETMDHEGSSRQRDHINAISTATWNEGQPDSPAASSPSASEGLASFSSRSSSTSLRLLDKSPLAGAIDSIRAAAGQEPAVARRVRSRILRPERPGDAAGRRDDHRGNNRDGPGSCRTSLEASVEAQFALDVGDALDAGAVSEGDQDAIADEEALHSSVEALPPLGPSSDSDEDEINDTIGAIAVDEHGHLAAASSSGGIGMKHRGRVGPAALVGIGTAVVPGTGADPEVSVAAVTSGTGEHMATTMASRRCAERIFSGTRMGAGGRDMIEPDDDSIMRSFIRDDFMGHPGVASCHSAGAIGVMVVKRTRGGIYFYFAHNTDSFALASMGGRDQVPVSVMSRLRESGRDGGAALGGRRVVV